MSITSSPIPYAWTHSMGLFSGLWSHKANHKHRHTEGGGLRAGGASGE